jgi:RNA polymerase sigma factor (sigma-70 family)
MTRQPTDLTQMGEDDRLAARFETQRPRLRAVAYRILGSLSEADDAVQESWLRLSRTGAGEIENLDAWLTTVVARICLNVLRTRRSRAEQPLDAYVPEPIVSADAALDPEQEALLADAVGLALQVVLETLEPPERLAYILHDMFAVRFDEIASMLERSPAATRQLASRARRRVQGAPTAPDPDLSRQRAVVDAFFAAQREGDLDALVAVLDPDIVLRDHRRARVTEIHGAQRVARGALGFSRMAPFARPVLINGAAGVVVFEGERPFALLAFTVADGRAKAIDVFADPRLVGRLDLRALDG